MSVRLKEGQMEKGVVCPVWGGGVALISMGSQYHQSVSHFHTWTMQQS